MIERGGESSRPSSSMHALRCLRVDVARCSPHLRGAGRPPGASAVAKSTQGSATWYPAFNTALRGDGTGQPAVTTDDERDVGPSHIYVTV